MHVEIHTAIIMIFKIYYLSDSFPFCRPWQLRLGPPILFHIELYNSHHVHIFPASVYKSPLWGASPVELVHHRIGFSFPGSGRLLRQFLVHN